MGHTPLGRIPDHVNVRNNWNSKRVVLEMLGGAANAFGDKTIEVDPARARKIAIRLLEAADAADEAAVR
jgi:hypothetical protein